MIIINSNYLKFTIEDLNSEIIIDPTDNFLTTPNLPLSSDTIKNCWQFYSIETPDGEDIERIQIEFSEYNPDYDHKTFDFKKLEKNVNILNFKKDLQSNILQMQEDFLSKIKNVVLNQSTDLQITHYLTLIIQDIRKSIGYLNSLNPNTIQKVLIELLIKNYEKTIKKIYNEYSNYLPKEALNSISEDKELEEFIYPDHLQKFRKIEENLISKSWLKEKNELIEWDKTKTKLVDFCRFLNDQEIARGNISITQLIRFIQNRYNIDVGTLLRPSKFNKRELKNDNFNFLLE